MWQKHAPSPSHDRRTDEKATFSPNTFQRIQGNRQTRSTNNAIISGEVAPMFCGSPLASKMNVYPTYRNSTQMQSSDSSIRIINSSSGHTEKSNTRNHQSISSRMSVSPIPKYTEISWHKKEIANVSDAAQYLSTASVPPSRIQDDPVSTYKTTSKTRQPATARGTKSSNANMKFATPGQNKSKQHASNRTDDSKNYPVISSGQLKNSDIVSNLDPDVTTKKSIFSKLIDSIKNSLGMSIPRNNSHPASITSPVTPQTTTKSFFNYTATTPSTVAPTPNTGLTSPLNSLISPRDITVVHGPGAWSSTQKPPRRFSALIPISSNPFHEESTKKVGCNDTAKVKRVCILDDNLNYRDHGQVRSSVPQLVPLNDSPEERLQRKSPKPCIRTTKNTINIRAMSVDTKKNSKLSKADMARLDLPKKMAPKNVKDAHDFSKGSKKEKSKELSFKIPEINLQTVQNSEYFDMSSCPQINTVVGDKFQKNKTIQFSWPVARALIKLQMHAGDSFSLLGIPWSEWSFDPIPTLGYAPESRNQRMYKAEIMSDVTKERKKVFIKSISVDIWNKQWDHQNRWKGEFVTDGENFVMEAAALAFLNQYSKDLTPKLLGILELTKPVPVRTPINKFDMPEEKNISVSKDVTHIAIVSELYGKDLMAYVLERIEQLPLTEYEKISIQYDCVDLLKKLHQMGLAHLDLTPENILFGKKGLRLCDFAKATPLYTVTLRHTTSKKANGSANSGSSQQIYPFESCEPTIGKGAYMPPECWKIHWSLHNAHIYYPLDELSFLTKPSEKSAYYFDVASADVYMLGILVFWLWSDGQTWSYSDATQDESYERFVRNGLNFDFFCVCRGWSAQLKSLLQGVLQPDPKKRLKVQQILDHSWFEQIRAATVRERKSTKPISTPMPHTARLHF